MTPFSVNELAQDADLWRLACQGNVPAFEVLVRRHQSLVCAVAYNACGDLTLSEDVAQETFWSAWRGRASLKEPNRLRAWLCGIARNLGQNARRREARAAESAPSDMMASVPAGGPGPADEAVSREEEALVWQTLEQVPDAYREPLILFYREEQSVAEVAAALELSEDAVKQRLARGRGMLRERMADVVEGALRRSRPGRTFTVAVMTGLTSLTAGAKTALAGGAGAAGAVVKAAGVGLGGGLVGGLLGSLLGLFGGWFGTWLPAQLAPTINERDLMRRHGRRMMIASVLFTVVLLGAVLAMIVWRPPMAAYLILWLVAMTTFGGYVAFASIRAARVVRRLRAEGGGQPNDTPLRVAANALASRYRGRVFRSRATLFGLPLLDINVSDPVPHGERRVARGWIAVGDDARGVLLAVGSTARGFLAFGGRAVGVVSFGGIAVGVVAVGGMALGIVAVGGLGLGVLALGGLAVGYQACGGGAVAWDVAGGGGAAAWHAAFGGAAYAHDYAVGAEVWALHANDEAAKALLLNHPLKRGVEWYIANSTWCTAVFVAAGLIPTLLMTPLMYRRA